MKLAYFNMYNLNLKGQCGEKQKNTIYRARAP